MVAKLDRTGERIVGVLLEKELSVPDTYPMSENALVDGCNQKNNREPVMELETFMVHGALIALREHEWVARVDGASRVIKYRHRLQDHFALGPKEKAVIAELLLRGPQAAGALKTRVARMGFHGTPEEVEAVLRGMASRPDPLVELMPLQPRERDQRWRHLLGSAVAAATTPSAAADPVLQARTAPPPVDLASRVATLEREVAALRARLDALSGATARP